MRPIQPFRHIIQYSSSHCFVVLKKWFQRRLVLPAHVPPSRVQLQRGRTEPTRSPTPPTRGASARSHESGAAHGPRAWQAHHASAGPGTRHEKGGRRRRRWRGPRMPCAAACEEGKRRPPRRRSGSSGARSGVDADGAIAVGGAWQRTSDHSPRRCALPCGHLRRSHSEHCCWGCVSARRRRRRRGRRRL